MSQDLIDLPFAEKIELFVNYVFDGRHHTRSVELKENCYLVKFWDDLTTWDGNKLTKVVVASHDLGLRVDVGPSGMRGLRLLIHNRTQRESVVRGHPTLEQHLEKIGRVQA